MKTVCMIHIKVVFHLEVSWTAIGVESLMYVFEHCILSQLIQASTSSVGSYETYNSIIQSMGLYGVYGWKFHVEHHSASDIYLSLKYNIHMGIHIS